MPENYTCQHPIDHQNPVTQSKKTIKVLGWSCAIVLCFGIVEAVSGWLANSLALLSDAGHMASDSFALALSAFAAWIASKPASKRHSYGLGRAEVIAAWISSILLVFIAMNIGIEAVERIYHPEKVSGNVVIGVAFIGMCINILTAWLLHHSEQTMNVRSALLHVLSDLLGSIAALASGIVIYFSGWMTIDPILSLLITVLILTSGARLLKETINVLMEGVPLHLDLQEVAKRMSMPDNVLTIHDLHIWTLSSGSVALSAHIEVADLSIWAATLTQLSRIALEEFNIDHITIQPLEENSVTNP